MKLTRFLTFLRWRTILAGAIAGGMIHILVTLSIPYVSPTSAYNQVAKALPENKMTIAPIASAKFQMMPFMTPEVRYALCRFNITRGAVRISARLLDPSWTLSLYTPQGDNFHTATGLASRKNDVTFDLVPPAAKFLGVFPTTARAATDRLTVHVPDKIGLMVLRAPINGTAFTDEVNKTLQLASCKIVE